jgi:hypothetical protein
VQLDDLTRDLRDANPLLTRRDSPLTPRAERELEHLFAPPPAAHAKSLPRLLRLRTMSFATGVAFTAVITIVLTISNLSHPIDSSVAAPPLLHCTKSEHTVDAVLGDLADKARGQGGGVTTPGQTISYEGWAAQLTIDEGAGSVFVQPEEVVKRWEADLSGTWVSRAGDVRYGIAAASVRVQPDGTLLRQDDFGPGAFPLVFRDAPPVDRHELGDYLRSNWGIGESAQTIDYFSAIEGLGLEWSLTGAETAGVLELLESLPDVTLAGTVNDRLGREGIAVQTERADRTFRMLLLFSTETGMLISSETVYLGGVPAVQLEFPTVFSYYAWKESL